VLLGNGILKGSRGRAPFHGSVRVRARRANIFKAAWDMDLGLPYQRDGFATPLIRGALANAELS
jgi:hypothetical protein